VLVGTALIAANKARWSQRHHPDFTVTLHAIDVDRRKAAQLRQRLVPFSGEAPDGVDVQVHDCDFADVVDALVSEVGQPCGQPFAGTRGHMHRSLWLVGPYGPSEIPLDPLTKVAALAGSEMIVNSIRDSRPRRTGNEAGRYRGRRRGPEPGSERMRVDGIRRCSPRRSCRA
jgi:hypothetical protein